MADVAGQLIDVDAGTGADVNQAIHGTADFPGVDPDGEPTRGGGRINYFTMIGMDAVLTTRDTWEVLGQPDTGATQYAGSLATPLRDVHVVSTRQVTV